MPFEQKQWQDRMCEYPARRRLVPYEEDERLVDVERAEGAVHRPGDAFSADNMNGLEKRVGDAVAGAEAAAEKAVDGLAAQTKAQLGLLVDDMKVLESNKADKQAFAQHESSKANPHGVTAAQVGALATGGTAADAAKLGGQLPAWWMPSGMVTPYAGQAAPAGWLLCDGRAVSRTAYSGLYAAIGTAFGAGDGSTSFNLPNLVGRFALGGAIAVRGQTGGAAEHTLTTDEMPAHRHDLMSYGLNVEGGTGLDTWLFHASGTVKSGNICTLAGGGEAHNNMPPYLQMAYIIKI